MKLVSIVLMLSMCISACDHPASLSGKNNNNAVEQKTQTDTASSFKVGTDWLQPKPSLKFNSVANANQDTLDLAICTDYVYAPFGRVQNTADFSSGLLKNFSVKALKKSSPEGTLLIHELTYASSKLFFFFDHNTEGPRHSFIIKGEINDSDVVLLNGIKTGITIADFYSAFFVNAPKSIQNKFRVIIFSSCVEDIKHVYTFKNNRLISIKFINDTTIEV